MKASLSRSKMHIGSHIVLIFWTFLVLFPLWTMIINSFKFKFDIYTDPFGLPKKWNFESYASVNRRRLFLIFPQQPFCNTRFDFFGVALWCDGVLCVGQLET